MRKFLTSIIVIIIILLIANFGFWFAHTRTITKSVETMTKQLVLKGVEFKYKDIKFTNFLAWDVKAVIEKPSIKYGSGKYYNIKNMERIDLRSNPIRNRIKIIFPNQLHSVANSISHKQELLIKFKDFEGNKRPFLSLKLNGSLAKLKDETDTSRFNNHIQEMLYYNDKFEAYDKTNENQLLFSGDCFSFWVVNKNENNSVSSGIKFTMPNLKYNPNYAAKDPKMQSRHLSQVELGDISLELDLLINELKHTSEESEKKNKSSSASKPVVNTQKIEFKKAEISTRPFGITIQGGYEKIPSDSFPLFNFKVYLRGYEKMLEIYASEINNYIDQVSSNQRLMPIKKVNEEQVHTFAGMLKRLSVGEVENKNDIILEIIRTPDAATISGKPIMLVIKQIQAIFFANLPGLRAFKAPDEIAEDNSISSEEIMNPAKEK
ncbi:hypothetical protein H1Q59_05830 [Holosporaceae bacterium 'Namur']|nr:hypothetical protein [Holosporaceae bacterium 'Namur']